MTTPRPGSPDHAFAARRRGATSWSTAEHAAVLLDEMDARIVDLRQAATIGGVAVDVGAAPDHVQQVPGSPEPPV